jgi:antitoxin YefM
MSLEVTYNYAQEHLAELLDQVEGSREFAVIHRQGHEDMVLIPADELASLRERARPVRSPQKAFRLIAAIHKARHENSPSARFGEMRGESRAD